MTPRQPDATPRSATDLFRERLDNMLNQCHALYRLADLIEWSVFDVNEFGALYCPDNGCPGKPMRLMVGLQYLKHSYGLSDEAVVSGWVENPYWHKPQSHGQPGYIRIDTVHQGDVDEKKRVYHINAVDEVTQYEVTQYEVVVSVERISEVYLIPALEHLLDSFPFVLSGFHADNGSEYINKQVARLLEKLRIEFTKSRARHSNDNALVECKNGHVVRKLLGHAHIPQRWAGRLNDFHRRRLNPYVNYYRPCLFPQTVTDRNGKQRKRYPYESLMTPYEKLKSIAETQTYLKPGLNFAILDKVAYQSNGNAAADALQLARRELFTTIYEQEQKRA